MTRVEQSIEVNVPVHAAYDQLTRFEQYPSFMEDVQEVRKLDDTRLHWHTKAGNLDMEWDAEITQQVPDRCIAWRNVNGPLYQGKIELQQTEGERTRLTLTMECDPGQQMLAQHGNAEAMIVERTRNDLARFKKFMEKLARDSGEWRGRPSDAMPAPVSAEDQGAGEEVGKLVARSAAETSEALSGGDQQRRQDGNERHEQQKTQEQAASDDRMQQPPWLPGFLQVWEQPMNVMRRMSEDMGQLFGRFIAHPLEGMRTTVDSSGNWMPPIDISRHEDRFVVCAELAGVRREDVHVNIRGDRLTIEGDRRHDEAGHPQEYRRSERAYGHFYRELMLPDGADADAASASLRDGVLEVTVPFSHGTGQARRIEIQSPQEGEH